MSDNGTDVVICGGGVIGAAVAYYLAKRGVRSTLVEANTIAHGASGYAAGFLSPPKLEHLRSPMAAILEQSYGMHGPLADELQQDSGIDYRFAWAPSPIVACSKEDALDLQAAATEVEGARWIEADELHDISPLIDPGPRGAYLGRPTGQLDSYLYTSALVAAAERLGSSVRLGRVTGLAGAGDRITGATLAGGETISADAVVVAMGPWSAEAGPWLGAAVPVEPLKGQILRLRPNRDLPLAGFTEPGGDYLMLKSSGLIYTGTTEERAGFDAHPTRAGHDAIRAFGARHASGLAAMEVVQHTACLRPLSPDDRPIIGAVPGRPGAFLATGHGRKGVLMSPATGAALAELILDGQASSLDLGPFDPARFAAGGVT